MKCLNWDHQIEQTQYDFDSYEGLDKRLSSFESMLATYFKQPPSLYVGRLASYDLDQLVYMLANLEQVAKPLKYLKADVERIVVVNRKYLQLVIFLNPKLGADKLHQLDLLVKTLNKLNRVNAFYNMQDGKILISQHRTAVKGTVATESQTSESYDAPHYATKEAPYA